MPVWLFLTASFRPSRKGPIEFLIRFPKIGISLVNFSMFSVTIFNEGVLFICSLNISNAILAFSISYNTSFKLRASSRFPSFLSICILCVSAVIIVSLLDKVLSIFFESVSKEVIKLVISFTILVWNVANDLIAFFDSSNTFSDSVIIFFKESTTLSFS